ncbi:MAG TPA: hypothetical protein VJL87_04940 [Bdellovibrionota bacterium]|nr:hypothetical protein [Bdellovibrionota bacterium]
MKQFISVIARSARRGILHFVQDRRGNLVIILATLLLIVACRQFQQKETRGSVTSTTGQFHVEYQLSYSVGDGLGEETPEKLESLVEREFNRYNKGFTKQTKRNAYFEVLYTEAVVRLITFTMNVWGTSGKYFGTITKEVGVFDFKEAEQKAREFFETYGYLLTGGGRVDGRGQRYIEFTLTEDYIDKISIDGRGREGRDGTCECYYDSQNQKHCYGTPGTDGEDGADIMIIYPGQLSDRLRLLEIHNEGGRGGFGGHCAEGPDGRNGYWGRQGSIFYRQIGS